MDRRPPGVGRSGAHKPDEFKKDHEKCLQEFITRAESGQSPVATANAPRQHARASSARAPQGSHNNQKHLFNKAFMVFVLVELVCLVSIFGVHWWFFTTAENAREAAGLTFVDSQCGLKRDKVCPSQYKLNFYENKENQEIPADCSEIWLQEETNNTMLIDVPRSRTQTLDNEHKNVWKRPYSRCAPTSGKFEKPWGEFKGVILTLMIRCDWLHFCNREGNHWNHLLTYAKADANAVNAAKTIGPVMYVSLQCFLLGTLTVAGILSWTYKENTCKLKETEEKLEKITQENARIFAEMKQLEKKHAQQKKDKQKKKKKMKKRLSDDDTSESDSAASDTSDKTLCKEKFFATHTPGSAKDQQDYAPYATSTSKKLRSASKAGQKAGEDFMKGANRDS